jgi:septal ring factor EnvC (AmiA/AmiB activator)
MARFGALLSLFLGLAALAPARAQNVALETLWNCKDTNGRTHVTNQKEDTVGKDCRIVSQQRVTVAPAAKPGTKSPAGFPKESASDRVASKAKQKDTIAKELAQEESMLADARQKLVEQEATRSGNESNYAKVLERLKPYQDTVEVHEKNVEALKRELSNLSR